MKAHVLSRLCLHVARQGELVSDVSCEDSSSKAEIQRRIYQCLCSMVLGEAKHIL